MQPRIDIHCHAVPPGYRAYALAHGHAHPDGMPALPTWSPEAHISLMARLNITKSVLSITSPGTFLSPSSGAAATRRTNEELAAVCAAHPEHFAFFASLPLPAVAESLVEIDYALDVLGAVGFAVLSNAEGVYLGDGALDAVFDHLDARGAVLFIHPTTCNVLGPAGGEMEGGGPGGEQEVLAVKPLPEFARPMMEFMFDETRAVANLLLSGTVARCARITFVMSHCGCTLPAILARIGAFGSLTAGGEDRSEELRGLLRERFYFDLAGFPFPDQIHGLLRMLGEGGESRLVYGTDYPFTPEKLVVGLAGKFDEGCGEIFSEAQRGDVYVGNAERLLGSAGPR